jgi:putative flippase GtrA
LKKKYTLYKLIVGILDIFYPLFQKIMNKRTYHYLACGGGNTLLALFLYYYAYHNILDKQNLSLGFIEFKPHIGAFIISFIITFPIGFLLSRFVVWHESNLPWKIQLSRHLLFVGISTILNYFLLKLFVELFDWWPMPSQILTTIIIVILSYITQKHFTFKTVKEEIEQEI